MLLGIDILKISCLALEGKFIGKNGKERNMVKDMGGIGRQQRWIEYGCLVLIYLRRLQNGTD